MLRTTEDPARSADPEAFWRADGVVVASIATARTPQHADPWRNFGTLY